MRPWQASFWDERASRAGALSKVLWRDEWYSAWFHEAQLRAIRRRVGPLEGLRVLEVGCGTGRLVTAFEAQAARAVGADFSRAMLREGKRAGLRLALAMDLHHPAFRPGSFDLVLTSGCLAAQRLSRLDLFRSVGELASLCRPGGRLLVMEPVHQWITVRATRLSVGDYRDALRAGGCEIEAIAGIGLIPLKGLMIARTRTRLDDALLRASEALSGLRPLLRLHDYKLFLARRRGGTPEPQEGT